MCRSKFEVRASKCAKHTAMSRLVAAFNAACQSLLSGLMALAESHEFVSKQPDPFAAALVESRERSKVDIITLAADELATLSTRIDFDASPPQVYFMQTQHKVHTSRIECWAEDTCRPGETCHSCQGHQMNAGALCLGPAPVCRYTQTP